MKRRPASDLERSILLALAASPAHTLTELARRIEASRPSVSRAAQRLASRKLLRHAAGMWRLTAMGQRAANTIVADAPARAERQVERALTAVERSVRHQQRWERLASGGAFGALARRHERLESTLMRSFTSNVTALGSPLIAAGLPSQMLRGLYPSRAMDDLFRTMLPADTTAVLAKSLVSAGVHDLSSTMMQGLATQVMRPELIAFAPMTSALEMLGVSQQRLMESLMPTMPDLRALLLPSISGVASLVADLYEMPRLTAAFDRATSAALLGPMTSVGEALRLHLTTELQLTASARPDTWSSGRAHLTLIEPTRTTSRLVRTVRSSIEPKPTTVRELHHGDARDDTLARRLRAVAPRLEELRAGAWSAIVSTDPATPWSSTHLARELITQLLHALAPDARFSHEERAKHDGRITRSMRVQLIVASSPTAARWIETMAITVDETYGLLSAEAHSQRDTPRFDHEQRLGMMETVDGLVRVILGFAQGSTERPTGRD